MAKGANLFRAPNQAAMEELQEAQVVADVGFDRCAHPRPGGNRQVLLMDIQNLAGDGPCARDDSREHRDRGAGRKRAEGWAETAHGRGGT
jgi:hypothetical protein